MSNSRRMLPNEIDLTPYIELFMDLKKDGDKLIAEKYVNLQIHSTNINASNIQQIIHCSLDKALEEIARRTGVRFERMCFDVIVEYSDGSNEIVRSEENLRRRLTKGRQLKEFAKVIKRSMRFPVEALLQKAPLNNRQQIANTILSKVSLEFARILVDERIANLQDGSNIRCECTIKN